MYIKKIFLNNFRNIENLHLNPTKNINLFYGSNGEGKTSLLESIYFCSMGHSMKTKQYDQLISFHKEESHIQVHFDSNYHHNRIDVQLKRNENRKIALNGTSFCKISNLFGQLPIILFSPDDLKIVKNSPRDRRKFLDLELCKLNGLYYQQLQEYHKILKQRNQLLKQIQKNKHLEDTLFVWDKQLTILGISIIIARETFLEELNRISRLKIKMLTDGKESLKIIYKKNCSQENLEERFIKNRNKDIFFGTTQYGPHKDDIEFSLNGQDAKEYASQGQQRSLVLAIKLAQIDLMMKQTQETPIVLLDDVFSELDEKRQKLLLDHIQEVQSFITCTGIEDIMKQYVTKENLFHVKNGAIKLT